MLVSWGFIKRTRSHLGIGLYLDMALTSDMWNIVHDIWRNL